MNRARTVRLTVSLLLALVVVALGGLSVARKIQAFQPLGFVGRATQGGIQVERADPQTGLRQGDLVLLLQNGEIAGQRALTEHLRGQAVSVLPVLRGLEVVQVTYKRPPLQIDVPYGILSLIGVLFLLIGLYTLVRKSDRQGFLFALWSLTSAAFYLLSAVPPVDVVFQAVYLGDEIARLLLPEDAAPGPPVSTSTPSSVTRTVCSNCAVREPSDVAAVHPSDQMTGWMLPIVIMGSMVKTMPGLSSSRVPGLP